MSILSFNILPKLSHYNTPVVGQHFVELSMQTYHLTLYVFLYIIVRQYDDVLFSKIPGLT